MPAISTRVDKTFVDPVFAARFEVRLGWRHMAVDRDKVKLDLSGPILEATLRF